ncbi:sensor domain-containing protein [Kitasatospora sp. NPDC096147]|uniref:sensor domain-containing protein n=1 Tax=Kitasatospora sp. NPDC096147 TaxID=3364093 RepID=UPI003825A50D
MTSQTHHHYAAVRHGDRSGDAARPGLWRAPISAEPYRELGFLLTALPLAVVGFAVTVALFAAGAGLLVTVLGLPVLAALTSFGRGFAALERHRARTLLHTEVGDPQPVRRSRPGVWGGVTARLADGLGWRAALYQVLMLPWSIVAFVLPVVTLTVGWVLAAFPAYQWVFARYTDWPGYRLYDFTTDAGVHHEYYLTSNWQIIGVCLVGLVFLLLSPPLIRGLTNVNRLAIRALCR